MGIFFRNAWCYLAVYFRCLSSVERRVTKIYKRNFKISWNFYKKDINYARSIGSWLCMKRRLDLMQKNLLLFACFRSVFINSTTAGADLGRGCRGCAPPPPPPLWDDLLFSNTTGILQKKTMWFIGVEVEQETSARPPKKILDPPLSA